jgi:hypothetical protein
MTKLASLSLTGRLGCKRAWRLGRIDTSAKYRTGRRRQRIVYLAVGHRDIDSSRALTPEHWNSLLSVAVLEKTRCKWHLLTDTPTNMHMTPLASCRAETILSTVHVGNTNYSNREP